MVVFSLESPNLFVHSNHSSTATALFFKQFKFEDVVKFVQTALPLNFIKFPLFEALNVAIREVHFQLDPCIYV